MRNIKKWLSLALAVMLCMSAAAALAEGTAFTEAPFLTEAGAYGDVADRCADLMKELYGDHFKAVFDFANFVQCGEDTIRAYELLRPYVAYIHIKDALKKDGSVVPSGSGDGNVAELLGRFKDSGYQGFLSLEPHLINFTGLGSLEKDATERHTALTGEEAFTLAYDSLVSILEKL